MPEKKLVELITYLSVPTFLDPPNDKKRVSSFEDLFVAINYSQDRYSKFIATVLESISDNAPADQIEPLTNAVNQLILSIEEARARKNKLVNLHTRHAREPASTWKRDVENSAVEKSLEKKWRDAHTFIGPIALDPSMPIVEVEINETYDAKTTRTLRSGTDPVYKTHKSIDMTMSLTIAVPQGRMNYRGKDSPGLYGLLATLKAFPLVEIISSAITPVYVNSILTPEQFEKIRAQIKKEVDQNPDVAVERSYQLEPLRSGSITGIEEFKEFVGSLNPIVDFMSRGQIDSIESLEKTDPTVAFSLNRLRNSKGAVSVSCAYMGCIIKTSPDKTNEFLVKLFFKRFNDKVFSPLGKMFYRDVNGDPTPEATECPWIEKIAMMAYGNQLLNPLTYMEPYKYKLTKEESGIKFTWVDPVSSINPVFAPSGKDWIIQDIEARSFMKAAALPLSGSPYGTFQYMGTDNIHAKVTVRVTDSVALARFHEMKADLDRINFEASPNAKRHHFVRIENNLLNFLGARDFVITGITTHRVSDEEIFNVEFEILESSVSEVTSESIFLKDENYKEKADVKLIWDHIYKLLSDKAEVDSYHLSSSERHGLNNYIDLDSATSKYPRVFKEFPLDANNPRPHELDAEGQLAWRLVFERVDDRGSGFILNPNIMAAAYVSLALKSTQAEPEDERVGRVNISWDTSARNNKMLYAVFEGRLIASGRVFFNDRDEELESINRGILTLNTIDVNAAGQGTITTVPITSKFNPISILEFTEASGVRFNRLADIQSPDMWPSKLTLVEKAAQTYTLNWLSKGEYEDSYFSGYESVVTNTSNAISDRASENIFKQGKELLTWMSMGEGRRATFFTKEFWEEYFNILFNNQVRPDSSPKPAWTNRDIIDGRMKLISLLREGAYLRFPGLATAKFETLKDETRFVRTNLSDEDKNKEQQDMAKYDFTKSNYGDLAFPTYAKVFSDSLGNMMSTKSGTPLWKEFAPTYSDLGIKPPYIRSLAYQTMEEAISKTARDYNDAVEPDAPYYHFRLKSKAFAKFVADQGALDAQSKALQNHPRIRVPAGVGKDAGSVDAYLKEVWAAPSERYNKEAFDKQTDHNLLRAVRERADKPISIVVIDEEGVPLGNVVPNTNSKQGIKFIPIKGMKTQIYSGDADSIVDPYSPEEMTKNCQDLVLRSEDRTGSMSRVFPAYRLYFIEKDRGYRFMADDLYGVNCLISLSIRKDKNDADVLVALISNTTDNLSNETVLTEAQARSLGLGKDDEGENHLATLKLQTGVDVQLRLGYGSNPEELPIVFTGTIVEIMPGKIVSITCQGHKRELLNEVQFDMESINHFDIVRKILEKTPHPNLGDPITAGRFSASVIASKFSEGHDQYDYIGITDKFYNRPIVDMSNIYIHSNAPLESSRKVYFDRRENFANQIVDSRNPLSAVNPLLGSKLAREKGSEFASWIAYQFMQALPDKYWVNYAYNGGRFAKWVVPPQSAWEALSEITRHRPGSIVAVVPWETRSTIFMGQPEQPYYASQPKHYELRTYNNIQAAFNKKFEFDFSSKAIAPFLESGWADVYSAHFKKPEDFEAYGKDLLPGDIYAIRDLGMFDPDELLELESLPDKGDKDSFVRYLNKTQTKPVFVQHIRRLSHRVLPPGFDPETHWWVYAQDIRQEVADINKINSDLVNNLFAWYYDLDPTSLKLQYPNISESIKPMFFGSDGPTMENFVNNILYDPNNEFATKLNTLKRGNNKFNFGTLTPGNEKKEVDFLVTQGLLSKEEAETILKSFDVKDANGNATSIRRSSLQDPVNEYLTKAGPETTLGQLLADTGGGFRLFLMNFYFFTIDNKLGFNEAKLSEAGLKNMRALDLPPGKRVFRSYHYITNNEIIENKIVASMEEMANTVLVRAPASEIEYEVQENDDNEDSDGQESEDVIVEYEETDWRSYPTTDGIPYSYKIGKENRKLAVVAELNAIHPNQKAKTLMSNMGLMLAPMYRGSLVVLGRDIKPHDVVYINDSELSLRGHFEVESVIHHFSVGTGFTTEIKPCALVRVNNPTAELQLASIQNYLTGLQILIDVLDIGLTILTIAGIVFTFGGLSVASSALRVGFNIGARAGALALEKEVTKRLVASALVQFGKNSFNFVAGKIIRTTGQTAVTNAALASVGGGSTVATTAAKSTIPFANFLGGSLSPARGLSLLGALQLGAYAANLCTSMTMKHLLSSTELPIDVHFLLYRGQAFQAGLDVNDRDVYSIYEKFIGVARDMKFGTIEFFSQIADDFAGVESGTSPLELAERREEVDRDR